MHISVTSVFIAHTQQLVSSCYMYLQEGKCLFILVHKENKKRIELPKESKLPSCTQHHLVKKGNHPKILDSVTSKSIMEKTWENIEEGEKNNKPV